MLGSIEHQVAPTAFSVQLTDEDAVRCTVGGVELLCDAADAAVTPGLRSGTYEPHLTAVFERYCTPGMTVVDVGANLGYFSLLASKLVGPAGQGHRARAELGELPTSAVVAAVERDHQRRAAPRGGGRGATGWAYYSTHVGSNGGLIDDDDLLALRARSSRPSGSTTSSTGRSAS